MQRARKGVLWLRRNERHSTEGARDCPKEVCHEKAQEAQRTRASRLSARTTQHELTLGYFSGAVLDVLCVGGRC